MFPVLIISSLSLLTSSLIILSSSSWFLMWLALELNMMSFLPLIYSPLNTLAHESMMKYFLVQVLSSISFLIPFILFSTFPLNINQNHYYFMITLALIFKLGAAPLHQWFPTIVDGMNWLSLTILLTWQKIGPMIILTLFPQKLILFFSALLSLILGSIKAFNHTKLKKIMTLSSISHLGWLFMTLNLKPLWTTYFLIYSLIVISLSFYFLMTQTSFFPQLMTYSLSYLMFINMMSLGGLPPLLGFLPKWLTFLHTLTLLSLMTIPMIISSLINLFIYFRLIMKTMIFSSPQSTISYPFMPSILYLNILSAFSLFPLIIFFL